MTRRTCAEYLMKTSHRALSHIFSLKLNMSAGTARLALAFIPKTLQKLSIKTSFLINDIFLLFETVGNIKNKRLNEKIRIIHVCNKGKMKK